VIGSSRFAARTPGKFHFAPIHFDAYIIFMHQRKTSLRRGWKALAPAGFLAALVGCADGTATPGGGGAGIGAPVPIEDPVVMFAASALPGTEDTVLLPGTGQSARVRLVRAYAAASGRECREVQVATGGGARSRLLCRAGEGWREARPLLREGSARP
jgi:hypothetical protein